MTSRQRLKRRIENFEHFLAQWEAFDRAQSKRKPKKSAKKSARKSSGRASGRRCRTAKGRFKKCG